MWPDHHWRPVRGRYLHGGQGPAGNDMELAKKVKPIELEIDQKEREIESLCMRLLLQQQPVAGDLRQISSR